ncbi:uncharacterized protein [Centruroides vittatus]|uniref:uncharacterized protein n=1 Tax=Centruroides vittatus TaxID=120091 RepID=UPI00350EE317
MENKLKSFLKEVHIGRMVPADNGNSMKIKPEWFDQKKFERVRNIFLNNFCSICMAHLCGLILIFMYTPTIEPFLYTGKSGTIPALLHRYIITCKHVISWYVGDIWNPKNSAHKSLITVRQMHKEVAKALDSPSYDKPKLKDALFFSQSGMAATQFAFVGWMIAYPEKIGLYCSKEESECLIHLWRCIGYLLGMDDRFNICDGNYEESFQLYRKIIHEDIKWRLLKPNEEGMAMSKDIVTALRTEIPLMSWLGLRRYWFEILELPVDFSLGLYDIICYWFYNLLFGVLLKNWFLRKIVNKINLIVFERVLEKLTKNE